MVIFFPSRMIFGTANRSTHWLCCWVLPWDIRLRVKSACVMWRWDELRRMQRGGQPANWPEPTWTNSSTQLQHSTPAVELQQLFLHPSWGKWTWQSSQNGPFLLFFFFLTNLSISVFFTSETSTFLYLDAVQFEARVERLRGSENKHFAGGEQRNIPNAVMLLPHLVGLRCNLQQLPKMSATSAKRLNCLEVIRLTFILRGGGGPLTNHHKTHQRSHQQSLCLCSHLNQFAYI